MQDPTGERAYDELLFDQSAAAFDALLDLGIYLKPELVTLTEPVLLEPPLELAGGLSGGADLSIGAFSYSWSRIARSVVSIGRYCSIAGEVAFAELSHPTDLLSTSSFIYEPGWMWGRFAERHGKTHQPIDPPNFAFSPPIVVGNDVWIGQGAYIRGGVTLGDGCIVGARAVITADVPPYAVVVGNPGRVVKFRFPEAIITELLEMQWWNYAFADFTGPHMTRLEPTLAHLRDRIRGGMEHYRPRWCRLTGRG